MSRVCRAVTCRDLINRSKKHIEYIQLRNSQTYTEYSNIILLVNPLVCHCQANAEMSYFYDDIPNYYFDGDDASHFIFISRERNCMSQYKITVAYSVL
jgi:hypothetical protein